VFRIRVENGKEAGEIRRTGRGDTLHIGRAQSSDLLLSALQVALEHASVVDTADGCVLQDHYATNGTKIERGGEIIDLADLPGREVELLPDDVILIGGDQTSAIRVRFEKDGDKQVVTTRRVNKSKKPKEGTESNWVAYQTIKKVSKQKTIHGIVDVVSEMVFSTLENATHVTVALRKNDKDGLSGYKTVRTDKKGKALPLAKPARIEESLFLRSLNFQSTILAVSEKRYSTIAVPLISDSTDVGFIQIEARVQRTEFQEDDLGVFDDLSEILGTAFHRALDMQRLRIENAQSKLENYYIRRATKSAWNSTLIGESKEVERLREQIEKVAKTDVPVLIEGEVGVGKKMVAHSLHENSDRADKLFIEQNCADVEEDELDRLLFGYSKGAFKGATSNKKGIFEMAKGGTVFLAEIGGLTPYLQSKLMTLLVEGKARPVGKGKARPTRVRVVASTHRDLPKEVELERFDPQLLRRLRVYPLIVPPLRNRRDDIPILAYHFLRHYAKTYGKTRSGLTQEAMDLVCNYNWPGNVQELQNEMSQLVFQAREEFIYPRELSPCLTELRNTFIRTIPKEGTTVIDLMKEVEKKILRDALARNKNSQRKTAYELGISHTGLYLKLRRLGIIRRKSKKSEKVRKNTASNKTKKKT